MKVVGITTLDVVRANKFVALESKDYVMEVGMNPMDHLEERLTSCQLVLCRLRCPGSQA